MADQATQQRLDGDEYEPEARVETRARPSIRLLSNHFELRSNARTIHNQRQKPDGFQRLRDKCKPRDEVEHIPEGAAPQEKQELAETAMTMDLPDFDEDWQVEERGGGVREPGT